MNAKLTFLLPAAVLAARLVCAQGTSITYQGRLNQNGEPATGIYDMRFTLHDSAAGATAIAGPLSNPVVGVTNGLFTVLLDFGAGTFNGSPRWLQIAVRTNGSAVAHTSLLPRSVVSAAPHAIVAGSVTGSIPDAQLSANIARLNGNQTFTGTLNFTPSSGAPFGVGANINKVSNLNADLLDGLDSAAFWKIGGNAGTAPGANYIGASDSAQVRLHATGGFLVDNTTPGLSFGNQTRQMLNLWGTTYGIGVQANTLYQRSDNNFAWFRDGVHNDGGNNPGTGGVNLMLLDGNGELFVNSGLTLDNPNANSGTLRPGLVFGFASGEGIASTRAAGANQYGLDLFTGNSSRLSITLGGSVGIGTRTPEDALVDIEGDTHINDHDIFLRAGSDRNHGIGYRSSVAGQFVDGPFVYGFTGGALGAAGPDSISLRWTYDGNVWVSNDLSVATLTIRGGADLAEPFPMAADIPKGALVVIDDERPGALKLSGTPYDNRVAGIVSGANGVNPGLTLQQEGVLEDGQQVALTGRVYALADASAGSIKPGDLLTSSGTPGHVMRVADHNRAQGAVVGKAMSALKEGKGMVLVLVNLQ